jgi:hypothetical protein
MSFLLLKHLYRVSFAALRERAKRGSPFATFLSGEPPRSGGWGRVEREHLAQYPLCQACRGTARLQVHHVRPFHLRPELELDRRNLITLCMGPAECHLRIGHGDDWRAYNPDVRKDAAAVFVEPSLRGVIEAKAKASRVFV